jgi:hypothetical protein
MIDVTYIVSTNTLKYPYQIDDGGSMNAKVIVPVIAVVAITAGAVYFFVNKDTAKTDNASQNSTSQQTTNDNSSVASKIPFKTVGDVADCLTYTFAELSEVWGVTFTDDDNSTTKVTEINGPDTRQFACIYNETNSGMGVSYSIEYRQYADTEAAKTDIADIRSTEKYGDTIYYTKEEKSGVGDEAFFWSKYRADGSKEVNQQMYIRKDNVVFLLSGVNLEGVDASYKDKLLTSYKLHFN